MTPQEVCERVVERLETTGWTQGKFGGKEGPNCLWGAIMQEVAMCSNERSQMSEAFRKFIGGSMISEWNDHADRTEFEVIDAVKTVGKMFANGEIEMTA